VNISITDEKLNIKLQKTDKHLFCLTASFPGQPG